MSDSSAGDASGTQLATLIPDALHLVCRFLDFTSIATLYATHSRLLCRNLVLPGAAPRFSLGTLSLSYKHAYLRANSGLECLTISTSWGTTDAEFGPTRRLKFRGFGFSSPGRGSPLFSLAAINSTSLKTLVLNETCGVSDKLESHFGPDVTFQTLLPNLSELVLYESNSKGAGTRHRLYSQLIEKLPINLKVLNLDSSWAWPSIDELPPSLTSLSISDYRIILQYATDPQKPAESTMRTLALRLPNLIVLRILLPMITPPRPNNQPAGQISFNVPFHPTNERRFVPTLPPLVQNPLSTIEIEAERDEDWPAPDANGTVSEEKTTQLTSTDSPGVSAAKSDANATLKFDEKLGLFPHLQTLEMGAMDTTVELSPILALCPTISTLIVTCGQIELGSSNAPLVYPPNLTSVKFEAASEAGGSLLLAPEALQGLPTDLIALSLAQVKFEFGLTKGLWGRHDMIPSEHPNFENTHWMDLLPTGLRHLDTFGFYIDFRRLPPRLEECKQAAASFSPASLPADFSCLPRTLTKLSTYQGMSPDSVPRLPTSLTQMSIACIGFNQEHVMALHEHLPHCRINITNPVRLHAPSGSEQYALLFGEQQGDASESVFKISDVMQRYARPFASHIVTGWSISPPQEIPGVSNQQESMGIWVSPILGISLEKPSDGTRLPSVPSHVFNLPQSVRKWEIGPEGAQPDFVMPHLNFLPHLTVLRMSNMSSRFQSIVSPSSEFLKTLECLEELDFGYLQLKLDAIHLPRSLTSLRFFAGNTLSRGFGGPPDPEFIADDLPPRLRLLEMPNVIIQKTPAALWPSSLTDVVIYAGGWTDMDLLKMKAQLPQLVRGYIQGEVIISGQVAAPDMKCSMGPQSLFQAVIDTLKPISLSNTTFHSKSFDFCSNQITDAIFDFDDIDILLPPLPEHFSGDNFTPFAHRRLWRKGIRTSPKDRFSFSFPGLYKKRDGTERPNTKIGHDPSQWCTNLPSSITNLKITCFDCPPRLMDIISPVSTPSLDLAPTPSLSAATPASNAPISPHFQNLVRLELVLPGAAASNPFHRFPSSLTELILHAEESIQCNAEGLSQMPKSLTSLKCDQLRFPPALMDSFPTHMVDLHFNGNGLWTDIQIQALGQRIGEKLVKIKVDNAALSGSFIPSNAVEVSDKLLQEWADNALGKRYDCEWTTISETLVKCPESATSIILLKNPLNLTPRLIASFPSSLTSLQLLVNTNLHWMDVQTLPTNIQSLSLEFDHISHPNIDQSIWTALPRSLQALSIVKRPFSIVSSQPGAKILETAPAPNPATHSLSDLPQSLHTLSIPAVQVHASCVSNLGPLLKTITVASSTPNKVRSLLLQALPNATVLVEDCSVTQKSEK